MGSLILLTGRPGVGKTTVFRRTVNLLRERGLVVGGMFSSEIRRSGQRIGFEISDLLSGDSGTLADIESERGPRIGKYRVNLVDLESIGVSAIRRALEEADIVCCDEIAPMELSSPLFREVIRETMESRKPFLGTIHQTTQDSLIQEIKMNPMAVVYEVTTENRNTLHLHIVQHFEGDYRSNQSFFPGRTDPCQNLT